jgi:ComF family protein
MEKAMVHKLIHRAALTAAYIREYLFPVDCPVCDAELLDTGEAWYGLCRSCMRQLFPRDEKRCSSCGRPLISEQGQCLQCREGEATPEKAHVFDGVFSIFPYAGKYRKLLGSYKFGKRLSIGNFFADRVLEAAEQLPLNAKERVFIPVPPRPGKIHKTGWDQVAYLGSRLRKMGLCIRPCLKRLPSKSQKELNKADRKTNLKGKILCLPESLAGNKGPVPREVIIFDDVITTGATLDSCATALKGAGVEKVYGICLFYD